MLKALKSHRFEAAQIIVIFYVFAILIATGLFCLPVALKPGVDWSFLDALFTAVSAVSVTGLAVVPYVDTFSTTGIFFLMFILQFGGIGIMTLGPFFWLMIGKKIGIKERQLISIDHNRSQLSGLVNVMKQILLIFFLIEMVGAAILGTYFLQYYPTWQQAYLQGTFASISATTNAGFDLTGMSLIPFAHDYFVQSIYIILLTVFCNRKMQNNAIKNAEVCHPISSFLTVRGTVYNSHHGMKLYVRDELICPLTLLLI